ncbi:hypothetical protein BKE38_06945 [Pseudoroseomonas deserti]|uniref:Protein kinase domain-containing protein n=1 Tax=Teichococcus deserti TaxID=1817963 RepID=A0A1V2H5F7_9PROT|nr:AAA family ATPase [Pseudoroseomonas deserti]ONG56061.1 hypothetical protein BKE38_06945 [Pseudoroseomonas deserti]
MPLPPDRLALLASDGVTRLCRAAAPPMLLLAAEAASDLGAALLDRAWALAPRLDPGWAAVPGARLTLADGSPALRLSDAGGTPLRPGQALPPPVVARIACGAAAALRGVHAAGLVHRDLRPAHLLADAAGGVRLTGFGRARAPEAAPPPLPGEMLPYAAPEQTGRVGRPVDARSDLYALGVILYEQLAGRPPFAARDAAELIHAHLARPPAPFAPALQAAAPALTAIVLRLLQKPAEDRYQSAAGLEADLRRCLDGAVFAPGFVPGSGDIPDRLRIPDRLQGRAAELARLTAEFEAVAAEGSARLALVAGPAGVGKSALVQALRAGLVPDRALLAGGKCEQFRRDDPYAALAQAMQGLLRRLLALSGAAQAEWRERLQAALGRNAAVLRGLLPELERLLGRLAPVEPLAPPEEALRFRRVLAAFLAAFARAERPLLLFLDDIQWLDAASLALLEGLAAALPRHLLLVMAYRDEALPQGHPLGHPLAAAFAAAGVPVARLTLAPLPPAALQALLAEALHATPGELAPLSALLAEKTGGNPFFAGHFLSDLAEEGSLSFDPAARRWRWDLAGIAARPATTNVVALMAGRLVRLAAAPRDLLATLACLGGTASAARLAAAAGDTPAAVEDALRPALDAGLAVLAGGGYGFPHDRIQEAAYALLPEADRPARHLAIARRLAPHLAGDEAALPELVGQYNRGLALVDDPAERDRLAGLNLAAGRLARRGTAFAAALGHFEAAAALLPPGAAPDRRFACAFGRAESLFLTGAPEAAEAALRRLMATPLAAADRAAAAALLVTLLTAQDRIEHAVEACLAFLAESGTAWSPHPGPEAPWHEYRLLRQEMAGRPIAGLAGLPPAGDAATAAFMDVLAAVLPPAFFSDQNLVCLVLCRMARISLAEGRCDASALGFAYLGMVLGPFFGEFRDGFAFGALGQALVEQAQAPRYEARVRMCFAYHVAPWTWPVARSLPLLRRAFATAVEVGDVTYCGFCACTLVTSLIAAGASLAELQAEAEAKLSYIRGIRFGLIADIITSQIGLLRSLRGLPPEPGRDAFEARLAGEPGLAIAACWHWIRRLQAAVHDGAPAAALDFAARAEPLLWTTAGHLEMAEFHFYAGLAHGQLEAAAAPAAPGAALLAHQAQLRLWAAEAPDNFLARAALLDAVVAAVAGDTVAALRQAEAAIAAARAHGLPQVEALAQECAAGLYRGLGLPTPALAHLQAAREACLRWGATGPLQRLAPLHRALAPAGAVPPLLPSPAAAPAGSPAGSDADPAGFDLASLVRGSQAVAGEAGLEATLQALMTTVLEHAGAGRGLLILPRSGELRVAAEAELSAEGIAVTIHEARAGDAALTEDAVPLAVIGQALETQAAVLIGDAGQPHGFLDDPWFAARPTRSVLCLPLLRQARLAGLLFLENRLAPHVFTEARLTVLRLLAAQAAIALENALLGEKEALLKEMHHRVKNNLQLISSLLNLQASRIADPQTAALFADSRDRVRSMALVHENLYRAGDYARVAMRRHLGALCSQLLRAHRPPGQEIRLVAEIAELHLDLDKAVACGLIVNELVSNAFKHAFAGRAGGRILVRLTQTGPGEARLLVADDGAGFAQGAPELEAAETLGLQLVGDLAAQLRGRVTAESAAEGAPEGAGEGGGGARFAIDFPLAAAG